MANFCFWKNIFSVKQAKKQVKDETDECGWSMKSFEQISWKKKTFFFHLLFVSIPFKDRLSTWISLRMHEILYARSNKFLNLFLPDQQQID
jgi:hypothetical protein